MIYLYILLLISGAWGNTQWISSYLERHKTSILSRDSTPECDTQRDAYFDGVLSGENWAFRMLDATGKIPAGLMEGHNFDLGYYDECLEINEEVNGTTILGNYCLFGIAIPYEQLLNSTDLSPTSTGIQPSWILQELANPNLRGAAGDVQFGASGVLLASLCIPDQCLPNDVVGDPGIGFMCETKGEKSALDNSDIACLAFIGVIVLLMTLSTAYDVFLHHYGRKAVHPICLAFSVYTNGKKVFSVSNGNSPNQILCLHGIKCLSLFWVISGHTIGFKQSSPLIMNINDEEPWKRNWYAVYVLQAPLAVDSFLFLSGVLLSYTFLKSMDKPHAKFDIFMYYLHRYIRLTPALGAIYFVTITIVRRISSGPMYSFMFDSTRQTCLDHWRAVFFYLQNYRQTNDMCLVHTWYLSLDMQVFVLSPIILLPLWKYRKQTLLYLLPVAIFASILCPFLILFLNDIQIWSDDYYNLYYYATHTRMTPWLIGIPFGVLLLKVQQRKLKINGFFNILMWALDILILGVIIFTQDDVAFNHNKWKTAFYLPLYRTGWAVCLGWIVLACVNGSGGFVNWFLSAAFFQVIGKLSYSVYLVHITVVMVVMMRQRTVVMFDDFQNIYESVTNIVFSVILGTFWMLAFESPTINIERVLLGQGAVKSNAKEAVHLDRSITDRTDNGRV